MSRRSTTPKRRKKSAASKLSRFWIPALVVIVIAAIGGYFAAIWSGFNPSKIRVIGNNSVSRADITAAAQVDTRRNLWLQDKQAMIERIEAIPFVDTVAVHRGFPASVTISITERKPEFMLEAGGARYVVDHSLRVLYRETSDITLCPCITMIKALVEQPGAFVTDPQAVAMRDDLDALAAAHVRVDEARYDKYESLIVRLDHGPVVLLGDDGEDLAKKIALIGPIRAQLAKGKPIAAIDLRAPNTPVVRYK
jgi:cell division septal protein FtsQ